jgi:hypothetical protein
MAKHQSYDSAALTDNDIFTLRCGAAVSGDGDLSQTCSAALWGTTHQQRSGAKRRLARLLEVR